MDQRNQSPTVAQSSKFVSPTNFAINSKQLLSLQTNSLLSNDNLHGPSQLSNNNTISNQNINIQEAIQTLDQQSSLLSPTSEAKELQRQKPFVSNFKSHDFTESIRLNFKDISTRNHQQDSLISPISTNRADNPLVKSFDGCLSDPITQQPTNRYKGLNDSYLSQSSLNNISVAFTQDRNKVSFPQNPSLFPQSIRINQINKGTSRHPTRNVSISPAKGSDRNNKYSQVKSSMDQFARSPMFQRPEELLRNESSNL